MIEQIDRGDAKNVSTDLRGPFGRQKAYSILGRLYTP